MKLGQVKLRSLFNNLAAWQKGLKTCQPWSLEHKLSHKGQLSQVYKERLHTFRKKKLLPVFKRTSTEGMRRPEELSQTSPWLWTQKVSLSVKERSSSKNSSKDSERENAGQTSAGRTFLFILVSQRPVLKAVSKFGCQLIYKVQFLNEPKMYLFGK